MNNVIEIVLLPLIIGMFLGMVIVNAYQINSVKNRVEVLEQEIIEIEHDKTFEDYAYPFEETAKLLIGKDTLHLTTIYFNQEESISTLHSYHADHYIFTGTYDDIELLIRKCKQFPNDDDNTWYWSYYQEIIDTYIIN